MKTQACLHSEITQVMVSITRKVCINTRLTHPLTQDSPVSITRRVHIQNQANLPSETRQATVCVTERVHIENQANSLSETRQATICITRRVHIKNKTNLPTEKRQATVCVTRRVHLKARPTHHLKQDRPQSVSPKECT